MTVSPAVVVTAAMVFTTTSRLVSGRPRQVRVRWQNSRCSILFHLLVPGGKWHTVICSQLCMISVLGGKWLRRIGV